jgi:hypothetical protein
LFVGQEVIDDWFNKQLTTKRKQERVEMIRENSEVILSVRNLTADVDGIRFLKD